MSRYAVTTANEPSTFATVRTAAKRLGIGERVLRGAIKRGEVPTYRTPGSWARVSIADAEAWLRSHRTAPTDHARARVAEVLRREAERERRAG